MAFKFFLFTSLIAAATAGLTPPHGYAPSHLTVQHLTPRYAPVHRTLKAHAIPIRYTTVSKLDDHQAPFNYKFAYGVVDRQTKDIKNQHESRRGNEVRGQYSLIDADGQQRVVDYYVDDVSGFRAFVRRKSAHLKNAQPMYANKHHPFASSQATPAVSYSIVSLGVPNSHDHHVDNH